MSTMPDPHKVASSVSNIFGTITKSKKKRKKKNTRQKKKKRKLLVD